MMRLARGSGAVSMSMVSSTPRAYRGPEASDAAKAAWPYTRPARAAAHWRQSQEKRKRDAGTGERRQLTVKETLESWATEFLNDSLARFRADLTRVEVQLTDEARGKQGPRDMRCMLEARPTGHPPVAVTHDAENMDEAFRGATQKLIRSLEHTFGKLDPHDRSARETIRRDPEAVESAPDEAAR